MTTILLAAALATSACRAGVPPERPDPALRVHLHQNRQNGLVNLVLVESENALVAVDGGFLRQDVEAVRRLADSIGKPLRAILLTHAHHDHVNGLWALSDSGSVP